MNLEAFSDDMKARRRRARRLAAGIHVGLNGRCACCGEYWPCSTERHQPPTFDGATYDEQRDGKRLSGLLQRVWAVMDDGEWYDLQTLAARCDSTTASVSARLRDFRKARFGGHTVERSGEVGGERGVFVYRLIAQSCGLLDGSSDERPETRAEERARLHGEIDALSDEVRSLRSPTLEGTTVECPYCGEDVTL